MSDNKTEIPNPPAYPTMGDCTFEAKFITEEGMTLRDYFAGQVMATVALTWDSVGLEQQATLAYQMADAMLKERNGES